MQDSEINLHVTNILRQSSKLTSIFYRHIYPKLFTEPRDRHYGIRVDHLGRFYHHVYLAVDLEKSDAYPTVVFCVTKASVLLVYAIIHQTRYTVRSATK
jgi:hypothetical protein